MVFLLFFSVLLLAACGQSDADPSSSEQATAQVAGAATEPSGDPLATLLAATVPATASPATIAPATTTPVTTRQPVNEPQVIVVGESITDSVDSDALILVPTQTPEPTPIPMGRVLAALVNVRSAPALGAGIVGTLNGGERLQVVARSDDGEWLRVCCATSRDGPSEGDSDGEAWIAAEYLEIEEPVVRLQDSTTEASNTESSSNTVKDPSDLASDQGLVNADLINLRAGPGTIYPTVGQATNGQILDLLGRNEANDWLQIGSVGEREPAWISAEFVTLASDAVIADLAAVEGPPTPEAPQAVGGAAVAQAAPAAAGLPGDGGFGSGGGLNPLTGLPLNGVGQGVRPIIVCINNDYAARPQYGTSQADVMYEYIMEGFGITRFSGIFLGESPEQIGPVRSARLINYYLGAIYNAGLACSGASDGVRYLLKHQAPFPYLDVDLDDRSNTLYSVSLGKDYRTRLRTSVAKLRRWLADWGVEEPARLRGFTFGGAAGGGVPATNIAIPYPSATGSQAAFAYDAGRGLYLRSMGGGPHLDGNTGAQIGVENVVVQYVPHEVTDIVEDTLGSRSIRLNLFGQGRAVVFRDGNAYAGTWRSDSRGDTPRFYTDDGAEVPLKPGKTWISVVPGDYAVSYQ